MDCRPLPAKEGKERWGVVLSETAFYPEGGGQPWDTGVLGSVSVVAVTKQEGTVLHHCTGPLDLGATVEGAINWPRRYDLMQQHSGEHIFSGLAHQHFGCDNVGFHLGEDLVTVDFNRELGEEDVAFLLSETNHYILERHPIDISYPDPETLEALEYRSKIPLSGEVKLVGFPGADVCACCGTHVANAGEVRLAYVRSRQKFREGVRIELLFGGRALQYLHQMEGQNKAISQLLSAKVGETAQAVERLLAERDSLKEAVRTLERQQVEALVALHGGQEQVILFVSGWSGEGLGRLAVALSQKTPGVSACFTPGEPGFFRYALASQEEDVRPLCQGLNKAFGGRGGGKANLAQGSLQGTEGEIAQEVADLLAKIQS